MYLLFVILQFVGIFSLSGAIIYIARQRPSREQIALLLTSVTALVNTVGYLCELVSTTKEMALMAVRMSYLGKSFLCISLLYFFLIFYNYNYNKVIFYSLILVHSILYILMFTCEYHDLFYTNIEFITSGQFPHLVITHGIGYFIHLSLSYAYLIVSALLAYYNYKKTKSTFIQNRVAFITIILLAVSVIELFITCSGLLFPYDITDITIVFATLLFIFVVLRYKVFDALDIAKDNIIENLSDALVILNSDLKILYCNQAALSIFPSAYSLDDSEDTKLLKHFCTLVREVYQKEDSYYDVEIKQIEHKRKVTGYIITLNNITKHIAYSENLKNIVDEKTEQLEHIQQKLILSFANMIELRDDITGHHVKRTSEYVNLLANALANSHDYQNILNDDYISRVCQAAPLHDIGKIAISDTILKKPGKLTREEFDEIKQHPLVGGNMLKEVLTEVGNDAYLHTAYEMCLYHHEKWDGSGYPTGLSGEDIPLSARIMAVADVFDALISKRSYKEALPYDEAFKIIEESAGSHFDPKLANIFLSIKDKIKDVAAKQE